VSDSIRIEALIPQPLPDLRRVSLTLRVSGLPAYGPSTGHDPSMGSGLLQFHDMPEISEEAHRAQANQSPPSSNVDLFLDASTSDAEPAGDSLELGDGRPPSPYPDVTLSIFDHGGNEMASTYIVEHKEPELDFTLHMRSPEPGASYTAYAELTMNDEVIQTVQVPFQLGERV
jgi:hypothetical protein